MTNYIYEIINKIPSIYIE